ncbi:hypothetical protein CkaCkLH20_05458 [Colletotrichum karsti]|uniref:Transporter SEO1 n=1 Tax=Colletotrichum karsti TaxID=1095194 RepID=A0A9P6I7J0_9PEZI|nr:uncharacterized protein CkaCkLH20_05458 [Colletotrichum karsti]KAF9877192.1 hypothetical protein CkaCkLH20_05458 [Colletotrichum karsti]
MAKGGDTPMTAIAFPQEKDDNDGSGVGVPSLNPKPNRQFSKKKFFSWFDANDGPLERRVIFKLDFFILSYAFIGFWILYIDRGILANAYISGMREDLHLFGNELVQLGSIFSVGYCVSMIPATLLVTKYTAHYVIPGAMTIWGVFTLLCYRANSFSELAGYRFMGHTSAQYTMFWEAGIGTMTTGLLAARIYESLDGALGHPGWRWMYIVASIMTFPIALWGVVSFPGTPKDGKRWYFTDEEFEMAKERMALEGRLDPKGVKLSSKSLRRFFGRWHFWVLVPWNVMWLMGYESMVTGSPTLWLKSNQQYSVVQVNNFTAISPSFGILFILAFSWTIDKAGQRAIVPLIGLVSLVHFISKFAWILYDETSFGFKWFAVALSYIEVSLSPVNYSVANLACAGDAEERAFVISSMLAISTAFGTWVPIVAFPTLEAPRFLKGYIMEAVMQVTYFSWTCFVVWYSAREHRKSDTEERPGEKASA